MKVLYAVKYPDALSESYISTEYRWMQRHGIEVCIWAKEKHLSAHPDLPPDTQIGGSIRDAIDRWKPDMVHAHWLTTTLEILEEVEHRGLPLTVRAHSFDFTQKKIETALQASCTRRIWVFPQFIGISSDHRVGPLSCCYDERTFNIRPPSFRQRRPIVFRAGAGVPGKGIEEFIEIAKLCPEFTFVLAITRANGAPEYPEKLRRAGIPSNLEVLLSIQPDHVARIMRDGLIYLRGHDPASHPYGLPVSIAEAMACGMIIIGRRDPSAVTFIDDAGSVYENTEQAAQLIRTLAGLSPEILEELKQISINRAKHFTTDHILPEVTQTFAQIIGS